MSKLDENEMQLFLAAASEELFSSIDFDHVIGKVAKLAVPLIADWCQITLVEDGELKTAAIAHVDPEKVAWAERLAKQYPSSIHDKDGAAEVIRTGKSILLPTVTTEMISQRIKDKKQLKIFKELSIVSAMTVPLKQNKLTYGAISFVSTSDSNYHFTPLDLYYAEELARRAAIALQNSLLYASAQKAIEQRDEFFSIASHELKTPITSIKAFVQIMQRSFKGKDDVVAQRLLERTNHQVDKLIVLIRDLLDVSKIHSGKLSLNQAEHDLAEVVQEIVGDYQTTTPTHQIMLQDRISLRLSLDKDRIEQVLTNLLSNAVKYSPSADKVIVNMAEKDGAVIVCVQDFGIGIAKQHLTRVFEKFYRSNPEQLGSLSSLGLGLFISAEIIERHGGKIWVESDEGKGSTFNFSLPI